MTDLSNQSQFDTDTLVSKLGALPDAPLAMPAQELEVAHVSPFAAIVSVLRPARPSKAGH